MYPLKCVLKHFPHSGLANIQFTISLQIDAFGLLVKVFFILCMCYGPTLTHMATDLIGNSN